MIAEGVVTCCWAMRVWAGPVMLVEDLWEDLLGGRRLP